jgi:hypothetical protein
MTAVTRLPAAAALTASSPATAAAAGPGRAADD